jgi:drug/metabolite transporter (DMT)-like permease
VSSTLQARYGLPHAHNRERASMSRTQWLLLVVLSVLWGGSFFFVGIAVKELPVFTIVLARVTLAAGFLLPVVLTMGLRLPREPAAWTPFFVMSLLNNVLPFTFITLGQKTVASGLASVLNATTPLFALVIAHLFADERLKANKLAGVALGILGVAILMGSNLLATSTASLLGMLLCLAGSMSYGFAALWGRRLRNTPPLVAATCQLMASTVTLGVLAAVVDRPWTLPWPTMPTVLALLGLALLATSLAYVIFYRILSVSGPTNVMLVTLLIPITGIGLGVTLLGETLETRHIIGALVIASGLLVIDGRLLAMGRRRLAG